MFGGGQVVIESPLIQEIVAERLHKAIKLILTSRFGPPPTEIIDRLRAVEDEDELDQLAVAAARCVNLAEFRARLST